ncbi:MAG: MqnA/MqnD/SBP family protein [Planctomycetota bacterium]
MPETPAILTLAHSPDADDLAMWWPLVGFAGREPLDARLPAGRPVAFELLPRDVEALNKLAVGEADADASERYDITAISAAAYPRLAETFAITDSGASFGEGYGPRVIVRDDSPAQSPADLRGSRIAVPGLLTTAFLTTSLMLGSEGGSPAFEPVEMLFSEIPGAVMQGRVDAGVLIHEAQLTFGDTSDSGHSLRQLADLGAWWGGETDLALPLGLNVIRRDLDDRLGRGAVGAMATLLGESVRKAATERDVTKAYLRSLPGSKPEWHDDAVLDRYLDMYVSPMTISMGERGRAALDELYKRGDAAGLCAKPRTTGVVGALA